jgi:DNA-binding transcriptional MerR regulator
MTDRQLSTGQVAQAAGVNPQTLRYYERVGLLEQPSRSNGGHRLYPEQTVTVLRVIKAAQRLGFSLEEVAELLRAGSHRDGSARAGLQLQARAKLVEVEARLAELTDVRQTLLAAIDAGCDDLVACADSDCCPLPFVDVNAIRPRDGAEPQATQEVLP